MIFRAALLLVAVFCILAAVHILNAGDKRRRRLHPPPKRGNPLRWAAMFDDPRRRRLGR